MDHNDILDLESRINDGLENVRDAYRTLDDWDAELKGHWPAADTAHDKLVQAAALIREAQAQLGEIFKAANQEQQEEWGNTA